MMAMITLSNKNGNYNTNTHNILLYDYRQSREESSQKSLTKTSDEGGGGSKAKKMTEKIPNYEREIKKLLTYTSRIADI